MQLRRENLLARRPNLLQQNWQNYQNVYVVSYLTFTSKSLLCLVLIGHWLLLLWKIMQLKFSIIIIFLEYLFLIIPCVVSGWASRAYIWGKCELSIVLAWYIQLLRLSKNLSFEIKYSLHLFTSLSLSSNITN